MLKNFNEGRSDLKPYGLSCELWQPKLMGKPDRHNEIEINYLPKGSITYLINDQKIRVEKGTTVVFWALQAHQIVEFTDESPYYVITIPFALLQQWELPKSFLDILFQGEVQSYGPHDDPILDERLFNRWIQDLETADQHLKYVSTLEIRSYLTRFAFKTLKAEQSADRGTPIPMNLVEQMATFIARNFTKPIKVSDVANEVELHPDYANAIFKKAFGSTISNFLIEQRVRYAQRRLTVTSDSITSIAFEAGFNSISRFNASFKKFNNQTPREFRQGK
ncbi:MAG: helix-turn-helix domain-containing protein [Cyclobacteriaceae bacterium]